MAVDTSCSASIKNMEYYTWRLQTAGDDPLQDREGTGPMLLAPQQARGGK